jgi:LysR family glycine cleavage system transcriptional activator
MPRIVDFMAAHPDWSVNIDSTPALTDFARDDVDVAIRFGRGPWPGLHCELLMDDDYILVASPKFNRGRLPKDPSKLAEFALLRADPEPWSAWCAAAGVDVKLPEKGVGYEDMGVMLQSAIDGYGLMLTRRAIAEIEIAKGALVQVFDISTPSLESYWIIWPLDRPPSDRVLAFREWLHTQAAAPRRKRKAGPRRRVRIAAARQS